MEIANPKSPEFEDHSAQALAALPHRAALTQPVDFSLEVTRDIAAEYDQLKALTTTKAHHARVIDHPELCKLNRYQDVPAFGSNMALLDSGAPSKANYLNANYVRDPLSPDPQPVFIAGQAPMPDTVPSFLYLLYSLAIPCVITIVEHGELKHKCFPYWPNPYKSLDFDPFRLSCSSMKADLLHEERALTLTKNGGPPVSLTHVHFFSWVDHSVPNEETLTFMKNLFETIHDLRLPSKKPVFVHCSAGIGRTGTLISAYFLYEEFKRASAKGQPFKVSIFEVVRAVREQRYLAVQTQSQYRFLYLWAKFLAKKK